MVCPEKNLSHDIHSPSLKNPEYMNMKIFLISKMFWVQDVFYFTVKSFSSFKLQVSTPQSIDWFYLWIMRYRDKNNPRDPKKLEDKENTKKQKTFNINQNPVL